MLAGKKFVVLGVANQKSIAWAISEKLASAGATLAFTYVNEAIEKRVRPLAESIPGSIVLPCDVSSDAEIDRLFEELGERFGSIDGMLHSIAFAEREDLARPFSETSREGFRVALDVSAYSLVALASRAQGLMPNGGSILTLSYLGSERAIPNYNVMGVAKAALESSVRYLAAELGEKGIRVNALSAGPIKTLAASGIPNFKDLLNQFAAKAPLRRNVALEDVANAGLFYMGDLSSGITGETTFVDCGFNIIGL